MTVATRRIRRGLVLATATVALAPMPGQARQRVFARRPCWRLAARRRLRRLGRNLVWVGVLSPPRLIRPVWRWIAPRRNALCAARIGWALRWGIRIIDR
jgi:hypothetical protein